MTDGFAGSAGHNMRYLNMDKPTIRGLTDKQLRDDLDACRDDLAEAGYKARIVIEQEIKTIKGELHRRGDPMSIGIYGAA